MSNPFLLEVGLELTSPFSFVKTATAKTSSEIITSPCRRESKDLCRLFYVANSAVDAFRGVLYHRDFFYVIVVGTSFYRAPRWASMFRSRNDGQTRTIILSLTPEFTPLFSLIPYVYIESFSL